MTDEIIQTIAVYSLPILFAVTLREAGVAYVSRSLGDNTAYSQGRMSLNPMVHIDIFGTIILPLLLFIASNGSVLFGYAKPLPINFGQLRNPKRDLAWVALAGPMSNFIMAFCWMLLQIVLLSLAIKEEFFLRMTEAGILANLMLFAFHLVPIPPFDGGRIAISLLPHKLAYNYAKLEPYGLIIVLTLSVLQILKFWLIPILKLGSIVLAFLGMPFQWILQ